MNVNGGSYGTIAGGSRNTNNGLAAAIGGGVQNSAAGGAATVPGGYQNAADADYTFAAGRRSKAKHTGTFVWGDSTDADLASTGTNQFIIRATAGLWLGNNSSPLFGTGHLIDTSSGAYLTSTGVWTDSSDRNVKENFAPLDGQEVLALFGQQEKRRDQDSGHVSAVYFLAVLEQVDAVIRNTPSRFLRIEDEVLAIHGLDRATAAFGNLRNSSADILRVATFTSRD